MQSTLYNIENTLVRQKNMILECIWQGELDKAELLLQFVKELWTVADYKYKYDELVKLIKFEREGTIHV